MKIGVVIVSAGKGKRLAKGDKATLRLSGKPLFCKSFNTFKSIKGIGEIVLVLRKSNFALAKKHIFSKGESASDGKGKDIRLVEGGVKRADSVFRGLSALSEDIEYVLIHDAARPFVTKRIILDILKELKKHPAVICGLKCPDTLKLIKKGVVKKTLSREDVYFIQTPQGFRKKTIIQAYKKFRKRRFIPPKTGLTDDAQMLEIIGKKIKVIPGDLLNFKITYPEDLKLAQIICHERL